MVIDNYVYYRQGKIKGSDCKCESAQGSEGVTKEEWKFLIDTKCMSFEKKELERAIKSNWEFMIYIQRQYEKIGEKLKLHCNDKEILDLINKTLENGK
mgnify:CR=1 FL=1